MKKLVLSIKSLTIRARIKLGLKKKLKHIEKMQVKMEEPFYSVYVEAKSVRVLILQMKLQEPLL